VFETDGSVKWTSTVSDFSSNRTGSSTFDFEGDGVAEVVYADEHNLRIYDGATGTVRFDVPHSSGTTYENPVIVDVDADGNAEIVIASNDYAFAGSHGIRAYRDAKDGWVNTRGIWNQHAYSVTNIEDDGTVPANPLPNWLDPALNTFRSNSQGTGEVSAFAAPDLTLVNVFAACVPGTYDSIVMAHVHNQGDAPASAGTKVSFYLGDPSLGGALWNTLELSSVLAAGSETDLEFVASAPGTSVEIFAVVDDNGTGVGSQTECDETNNSASTSAGLLCTPNNAPVAVCEDRFLAADEQCVADASVDAGSFDPDGDAITLDQSPTGSYGPGETAVTLEVCDDLGACESCEATITVEDTTPPTVVCNNTAEIAVNDTPTSFTASTEDNCGAEVVIAAYDCFKVMPNGEVRSRLDACVVSLDGATVVIEDAGGVGTHITWTATATDSSGNSVSTTCETEATNPSQSGCNQGVGNGAEGCDPGNSNQGDPGKSNDENGSGPGNPGKKGGH
jgi:hypothetical protein